MVCTEPGATMEKRLKKKNSYEKLNFEEFNKWQKENPFDDAPLTKAEFRKQVNNEDEKFLEKYFLSPFQTCTREKRISDFFKLIKKDLTKMLSRVTVISIEVIIMLNAIVKSIRVLTLVLCVKRC